MNNDKDFYNGKVSHVDIADEMKNDFLSYAMSVIVARALPDVRDGLKPVHRRIIYAMWNLNMTHDKQHKKSARIVGEVIGKYHPHGETAVYDAMVRMAQDFSFRYPLIDGHGNFGSLDGDPAAAMRYTEARMSEISEELIKDIDKETVEFIENYDATEQEPVYLPGYIPNVLINGVSGIAVGMATNIPPHNISEVIDAIIALANNKDTTIDEILEIIKGPDFPTGALIATGPSLRKAYQTGNGSVIIRAKVDIVKNKNNKKQIIVSEIPYQVNKSRLTERISELIKEKILVGMTEVRDESNREGVRVVMELRDNAQEKLLLDKLYKLTPLQTNYSINFLALNKNQPKVMNIKQILSYIIEHQIDIIVRRSNFDLAKNKKRLLILEGLSIALQNIDEIIQIIRSSQTTAIASQQLIERFKLHEEQAKAILEMRLQRLTGLEAEKIAKEISEIKINISELENIINNENRQFEILIKELTNLKKKYGDERRSQIISDEEVKINSEVLIRREDVLILLSEKGYIKSVPSDTFKPQKRGGKGITSLNSDIDYVTRILQTNTIHPILLFSNKGKVYKLRAYQVESYSRQARGLPIVNLIKLDKDEKITTMLSLDNEIDFNESLVFATKKGIVKKTPLSEFNYIPQNGKVAIEIKNQDELVDVVYTKSSDDIVLAASNGKVVRFLSSQLRPMGRQSIGVKGIELGKSYELISVCAGSEDRYVLSVTDRGYAKLTHLSEYRRVGRSTKGVKSINLTDKKGNLCFVKLVEGNEELVIGTKNSNIICLRIKDINIASRATSGVKIVRIDHDDAIKAIEIKKAKYLNLERK